LRRPLEKGGWDVALNLAHMAVYEEKIALPVLESALRGGDGNLVTTGDESWFETDSRVFSAEPIEVIVERLTAVRRREIDAVSAFSSERFNESVVGLWSEHLSHCAGWVAAKTFQHPWEHGNFVLRVGLFSPLFSEEAWPEQSEE
jgi:DinB superfamily